MGVETLMKVRAESLVLPESATWSNFRSSGESGVQASGLPGGERYIRRVADGVPAQSVVRPPSRVRKRHS